MFKDPRNKSMTILMRVSLLKYKVTILNVETKD